MDDDDDDDGRCRAEEEEEETTTAASVAGGGRRRRRPVNDKGSGGGGGGASAAGATTASSSSRRDDGKDDEEEQQQAVVAVTTDVLDMCCRIETHLHEMKNALKCPVCLETLKHPAVVLPCTHQFCRICLSEMHHRSSASGNSSSRRRRQDSNGRKSPACCPVCRSAVPSRSLSSSRRNDRGGGGGGGDSNTTLRKTTRAFKELLVAFGVAPVSYDANVLTTQVRPDERDQEDDDSDSDSDEEDSSSSGDDGLDLLEANEDAQVAKVFLAAKRYEARNRRRPQQQEEGRREQQQPREPRRSSRGRATPVAGSSTASTAAGTAAATSTSAAKVRAVASADARLEASRRFEERQQLLVVRANNRRRALMKATTAAALSSPPVDPRLLEAGLFAAAADECGRRSTATATTTTASDSKRGRAGKDGIFFCGDAPASRRRRRKSTGQLLSSSSSSSLKPPPPAASSADEPTAADEGNDDEVARDGEGGRKPAATTAGPTATLANANARPSRDADAAPSLSEKTPWIGAQETAEDAARATDRIAADTTTALDGFENDGRDDSNSSLEGNGSASTSRVLAFGATPLAAKVDRRGSISGGGGCVEDKDGNTSTSEARSARAEENRNNNIVVPDSVRGRSDLSPPNAAHQAAAVPNSQQLGAERLGGDDEQHQTAQEEQQEMESSVDPVVAAPAAAAAAASALPVVHAHEKGSIETAVTTSLGSSEMPEENKSKDPPPDVEEQRKERPSTPPDDCTCKEARESSSHEAEPPASVPNVPASSGLASPSEDRQSLRPKAPDNICSPLRKVTSGHVADRRSTKQYDDDGKLEGLALQEPILLVVGTVVKVQRRMGPGMNSPGGIGRITAVKDGSFDIKYVLGGTDKNVHPLHVEPFSEVQDTGKSEGEAQGSRRRQPARSASKSLLPPELLAELARDGYDTTGSANVLRQRVPNETASSDRLRKRRDRDCSGTSGKKRSKVFPKSKSEAANEVNGPTRRSSTGSVCADADSLYRERVQQAFSTGTVNIVPSGLTEHENEAINALVKRSNRRACDGRCNHDLISSTHNLWIYPVGSPFFFSFPLKFR